MKHGPLTELIERLRVSVAANNGASRSTPFIEDYVGTELPIISNSDRGFATALRKIVNRSRSQSATVEKSVRTILQAVERGGDRAVLRYTKKFDRLTLKPEQMRVTADEIKDAYYHIRKDEGDALRYAAGAHHPILPSASAARRGCTRNSPPPWGRSLRPWMRSGSMCRVERPSIRPPC
ncbi:MAG: histidinol dehydrogenase [Nitrospiraceae bacterium]